MKLNGDTFLKYCSVLLCAILTLMVALCAAMVVGIWTEILR